MINKQSLWFVTLFSIILVLSIYYVTISDSSLKEILGENVETKTVASEVTNASYLVALRVEEDELVLKEMNEYQEILLDNSKTSEEKSNAYTALTNLNNKKGKEQEIEKKILEEYKLESFVKIKDNTITITISKDDHNANLANNIIKTAQSLYDKKMYITVKFQA